MGRLWPLTVKTNRCPQPFWSSSCAETGQSRHLVREKKEIQMVHPRKTSGKTPKVFKKLFKNPVPLQRLAWITNPSTRQPWHSPVSPAQGWLTVKMNVPSLWYYYLITMACMSNPSNKHASLCFSWQQQPPAARETSQPTQVSVRTENSVGIAAKAACPSWGAAYRAKSTTGVRRNPHVNCSEIRLTA